MMPVRQCLCCTMWLMHTCMRKGVPGVAVSAIDCTPIQPFCVTVHSLSSNVLSRAGSKHSEWGAQQCSC